MKPIRHTLRQVVLKCKCAALHVIGLKSKCRIVELAASSVSCLLTPTLDEDLLSLLKDMK